MSGGINLNKHFRRKGEWWFYLDQYSHHLAWGARLLNIAGSGRIALAHKAIIIDHYKLPHS
jgi:hypothetical protein